MALKRGYDLQTTIGRRVSEEIDGALKHPVNVSVTEFLATLVAHEVLSVRIAFKRNSLGVYHNKIGVFYGQNDCEVSFLGTTNETLSAWCSERNHEGLEVFCSWRESDRSRVSRHQQYFQQIWEGENRDLEIVDFREVAWSRLEDLVVESGLEEAASRVRSELELSRDRESSAKGLAHDPDFSLFPHQSETVKNWFLNEMRGIVKHATGAGKTITALEIARRWIEEDKPVLIVVPTVVLVRQWIKEAEQYLGEDVSFLQVGGGKVGQNWEPVLGSFTSSRRSLGRRITVATRASASLDRFITRCSDGEHLLLIADEVHTVGSAAARDILTLNAGGRLGLSATPERYGDPEGTELLVAYFGDVLDPEVSLSDAIKAGRLVPYDYHIHKVALTEEEQSRWNELTVKIQRAYASLPESVQGQKIQTENFKLLLIRRARILKQADGKIDVAARVLEEFFRPGERWLVYCDSREQLEEVSSRLSRDGIPTMEFHSAMEGSDQETLEYFAVSGGALVAIRCLDEGVDIPAADNALILASSSNPREFIQRRGRILRSAKGKHSASVHDALVFPSVGSESDSVGQPILRGELKRAAVFAEGARNRSANARIRLIAQEAEISMSKIGVEAFEVDRQSPN